MNYNELKLSKEEIMQFPQFKDLSDDELDELAVKIIDLTITTNI